MPRGDFRASPITPRATSTAAAAAMLALDGGQTRISDSLLAMACATAAAVGLKPLPFWLLIDARPAVLPRAALEKAAFRRAAKVARTAGLAGAGPVLKEPGVQAIQALLSALPPCPGGHSAQDIKARAPS